jgi:hypothetical protein
MASIQTPRSTKSVRRRGRRGTVIVSGHGGRLRRWARRDRSTQGVARTALGFLLRRLFLHRRHGRLFWHVRSALPTRLSAARTICCQRDDWWARRPAAIKRRPSRHLACFSICVHSDIAKAARKAAAEASPPQPVEVTGPTRERRWRIGGGLRRRRGLKLAPRHRYRVPAKSSLLTLGKPAYVGSGATPARSLF